MTDLPPAAPLRHRAPATPAQVARRMVPPFLAVSSVAAVILLLLVLNSRPTPPGPGPGAVAQLPAASSHRVHLPVPSLASAASATPTATLPVHEPPATQPPAAAVRPTHAPPASAQPADARPPVTVLNNSRRTGLAHQVAAQLRADGWLVRQTGNFRGRVRSSTAYYPAGGYAAAAALARQLPQIRRILPRFAGLPGAGLTLVLTRDWS